MWGLHKKKKDRENNDKQKDELAKRIANKVIRIRAAIVRRLESCDRAMTQMQRKIAFYSCMLIWSGCMLYILGNAVRQQPAPFVLPLYDSADIRQRMYFDSILSNHNEKNIHQTHIKTNNGKK